MGQNPVNGQFLQDIAYNPLKETENNNEKLVTNASYSVHQEIKLMNQHIQL